jgi:hypothetical protein
MARISQREARSLKKRVTELEAQLSKQHNQWTHEWPGSAHIDTMTVKSEEWHIATTARKLGHAVVIVPAEHPKLKVYGCPLPK